jgi:hypothetical protein
MPESKLLEKTMKKTKFACLKSLKKRVESISQRYGSGDLDSDPRHGTPTLLVGMSYIAYNEFSERHWSCLKKNFKLEDDILKSSLRPKTSSTGGVLTPGAGGLHQVPEHEL